MARLRVLFATMGAGLLAAGTLSAEVTCEKLRVEPLRCVGGTIIDQADGVIPRAEVSILKDDTVIATVETGLDGKFRFGELKAGSYDLQARAPGFRFFSIPIVLKNPAKKCTQVLEIVLPIGGEYCKSIRLVRR